MSGEAKFPDGLSEIHLQPKSSTRFLNLLLFAILGLLMVAAFFGVLGGQPNQKKTAQSAAADLEISTPQKLRNGEFFETRISINAKRALDAPSIAVSSDYWNDVTVNTLMPEPANQSWEEGYFVLEFDALDAGDFLLVKIDGQSNPTLRGGNRGVIQLRDGEDKLAQIPLRLEVLP